MTVVIIRRSTKLKLGTLEIQPNAPGVPGFRIDQSKLTEAVDARVIAEIGRRVMNASGMGGDIDDIRWDVTR